MRNVNYKKYGWIVQQAGEKRVLVLREPHHERKIFNDFNRPPFALTVKGSRVFSSLMGRIIHAWERSKGEPSGARQWTSASDPPATWFCGANA
jgi:hypothetical protein